MVDATTELDVLKFWARRPRSSASRLGWYVEVQHGAFPLNWLEPPLGDAVKDFNLHRWQPRIRIAGPRSANPPDNVVLEVVEEHPEGDFNPLHSRPGA